MSEKEGTKHMTHFGSGQELEIEVVVSKRGDFVTKRQETTDEERKQAIRAHVEAAQNLCSENPSLSVKELTYI
jgi:hypothetical protein